MPSKHEEYRGRITVVKHFNEDRDNPFIILELEDYTCCLGSAEPEEFTKNLDYVFYGYWKESISYGRQFQFKSFMQQKPATEKAVMAYLKRCPNIGQATARKLWKFHGVKAVDAAKDPGILMELSVPMDRAQTACEWLVKREQEQEVNLALTDLFAGHNLPRDLTRKCVRRWGMESPELIRDNPFELLVFDGVGFKSADAIWQQLGKPLDSLLRGAHCAAYAVQQANDGSTWYPRKVVHGETRAHLGTNKLEAAECIDKACEMGLLDNRDGEWYAESSKSWNEAELAGRVLEIHASLDDELGFVDYGKLKWPAVDTIEGLSDHQREQLTIALSGPIGILTGGPGVGKTYTVAQLVKAILARGSGGIGISAPTGKAAVRALEALKSEGVTGVRPTTMHSKLKFTGSGWKHGRDEPLPFDLHILDEESMVTTDLERAYFDAVPYGGHVLLVLDPHQLPPVGHGRPALDLIKWGIPTGVLSEPRRNSGQIVQCCMDIRQKRLFSCSSELNLETGDNLVMTEARGPDVMLSDLEAWLNTAQEMGFTHEEIQVIAPMNERGPVSVKPLNKFLQRKLNPGESFGEWKIRVNDKVVCTKNGMYPMVATSESIQTAETYIANGEQGYVEEVRDKSCIVRFPYPDRWVRYGMSGPIELAWCITAHKSQGSEWPVTLVVFDPGADRLGTAEWVTTGISRAKKFCVGIGRKATAQKWVGRTGLFKRKTFLRERMTANNNESWSLARGNQREESRQPA